MKRRRVILISLVAVAVPAILLAAMVLREIITPATRSSASVFKGWRELHPREGDVFEVAADHQVRHGGRTSAFIRATAPTPPSQRRRLVQHVGAGRGELAQDIRADAYRGKRVRLSAYLKTAGVGTTDQDGANFSLWVGRAEGWLVRANQWHRDGDRRVKGTTDCARYEHVVDVPEEATLLIFRVSLFGSWQIWIDDVKLEVVGREISCTQERGEETRFNWVVRQRMANRVRTALPQPVNLAFEE